MTSTFENIGKLTSNFDLANSRISAEVAETAAAIATAAFPTATTLAPGARLVLADPIGSALGHYVETGQPGEGGEAHGRRQSVQLGAHEGRDALSDVFASVYDEAVSRMSRERR